MKRPLWRIVWRFNKLGIKLPYNPPISLLSINPEKTTIQKHMHPNVKCSTIDNSQDTEAT